MEGCTAKPAPAPEPQKQFYGSNPYFWILVMSVLIGIAGFNYDTILQKYKSTMRDWDRSSFEHHFEQMTDEKVSGVQVALHKNYLPGIIKDDKYQQLTTISLEYRQVKDYFRSYRLSIEKRIYALLKAESVPVPYGDEIIQVPFGAQEIEIRFAREQPFPEKIFNEKLGPEDPRWEEYNSLFKKQRKPKRLKIKIDRKQDRGG